MMANVTSPALIAAEAAANSQNTLGSRPCKLDSSDSRRSGLVAVSVESGSSPTVAGVPIFRQIQTRMIIEIAAGMISTAMAGQSVPAAAATAATRTGPATAPI